MKRFFFLTAFVALIASLALLQTKAQTPSQAQKAAPAAATLDQYRDMLSTYCYDCHNSTVKSGGLVLEGLDIQNASDDAQVWEKAVRKLRGRLMPPPGNAQ